MPSNVPNFGRPRGRVGPPGVINPVDPNKNLMVNLVVLPARQYRSGPTTTPRDSEWMLAWDVGLCGTGHVAQRRCRLIQEPRIDHLTNWGVITDAMDHSEHTTKIKIPLRMMTLAQRQILEAIANNTRVRVPDGNWNGQNWCLDVMEQAIRQGLLSATEVSAATKCAWSIPVVPA